MPTPSPVERRLVIGLNVALVTLRGGEPHVLCVRRPEGWGLPFGQFDPLEHRTFELALRDFVERQTAVPLGYAEQLYTFGDRGREAPRASLVSGDEADRIVSVGYLALAPGGGELQMPSAAWRSWYDHFPWEDRRQEMNETLRAGLKAWAGGDEGRRKRLAATFPPQAWEEERALERYELMYEAELVTEALRDRRAEDEGPVFGEPMISDHRRILATAIGRLRGKLRYRPIVFELLPTQFTLGKLQGAVEGILGFCVHKQNFRRGLEAQKLVVKTAKTVKGTGGRPAAIYRPAAGQRRTAAGLTLPRFRPCRD